MGSAPSWLEKIRALDLPEKIRVLNVCGGHERTIAKSGLRAACPPEIELIPGPGCPVCVCPEEDVYAALELAKRPEVTLVAFGDMLHVPANVPKGAPRTLAEARGLGADIRPIAAPQEAAAAARELPGREVVFFAAGFETTTAPVASLLIEGAPENLTVLLSARRTWPAVAMLLESEAPGFEGLIAPGHVATVMGAEEWRFAPERHGVPTAIAGFSAAGLLAALHAVLVQAVEGRPRLENRYAAVVRPEGNPSARRILDEALTVVDANWRGIGVIPASGYALAEAFAGRDARRRFEIDPDADRKRAGAMPPGCDCARVVLGKIYPDQCALYGRACTPRAPIGPCMVSDEGACRIWWSTGVREARTPATKIPEAAESA